MKSSEIMELINTVEDRFPVDRWMINGIHVWPLIRINLTYDLFHSHTLPQQRGIKKTAEYVMATHALRMAKNLARFPFAWLADRKNNLRQNNRAAVAFLSDGVSFVDLDGKWYDRFCDPLIERFHNLNVSSFMMTLSHDYIIPRYSPSRFIQPFLDLLKIIALFRSKLFRGRRNNLPGFSDFIAYFESLRLDAPSLSLFHITWQAFQIRLITDYYKRILKKSGASLGFVVSYYGIEGMAFNLACRELAIHSVDIQHGYQGDICTPYGRWNNVPAAGYELLPSLFWCWTEYEAKAIRKWSSTVSQWHKPVVGGNLFARQWQSGDVELVGHFDELVSAVKTSYPDSMHVLYTLNCISASEFKKLASIIRAVRESRLKTHFWIRLHPCRLHKKPGIMRLLQENGLQDFELDIPSRMPLYALLRHMDIHMTEFSSTVVEAEQFGVPSVIVNEFGIELYPDQVASGWALPACSVDEIVDAVRLQYDKRALLKRLYEASQVSDRQLDALLLSMIQNTA